MLRFLIVTQYFFAFDYCLDGQFTSTGCGKEVDP